MTLTPKARVVAQVEHWESDFVPYTIGFEGDIAEQLDGYYDSAAWRGLIDNAIRYLPGPNLWVDESVTPVYTDPYGSVWRTDLRPYHLERAALARPSLTGYTFPDLSTFHDEAWREEALAACSAFANHFMVADFGFGLIERTWALRGFEQVLSDVVEAQEFYAELVEQIADHQLSLIDRLLKLPVDGIMFADDWGYQKGVLLGPQRWRRFIKPHLARQYARVHAAGKYVLSHCCGSVVDILPDLIEIGLDVLESVQPEARGMNPYELKRGFGDRITFWGCLGSQSTIPFSTPEQIRAEVHRLCAEMGRHGGYILSPSKELQPGTPVANAAAVVESFLLQSGVELRRTSSTGTAEAHR